MPDNPTQPTGSQPTPLLSVDGFAQTIKTRYPVYNNIDNQTLAKAVLAKYPVYAQQLLPQAYSGLYQQLPPEAPMQLPAGLQPPTPASGAAPAQPPAIPPDLSLADSMQAASLMQRGIPPKEAVQAVQDFKKNPIQGVTQPLVPLDSALHKAGVGPGVSMGVAHFLSQATTPENLALLGGTGGLLKLAPELAAESGLTGLIGRQLPNLGKLLGAVFSGQGIAEGVDATRQAHQLQQQAATQPPAQAAESQAQARQVLTEGTMGAVLGLLGVRHLMREPSALPAETPAESPAPAETETKPAAPAPAAKPAPAGAPAKLLTYAEARELAEARRVAAQAATPAATIPTTDNTPTAQPTPPTPEPTKPPQFAPSFIRNAKPRYGYQDKLFSLDFADPRDKALFTIAQATKNPTHDAAVQWLQTQFPGTAPEDLLQRSLAVRDQIKQLAATGDPAAGPLKIPSLQVPSTSEVTPPSTPVATATVTPPALTEPALAENVQPDAAAAAKVNPAEQTQKPTDTVPPQVAVAVPDQSPVQQTPRAVTRTGRTKTPAPLPAMGDPTQAAALLDRVQTLDSGLAALRMELQRAAGRQEGDKFFKPPARIQRLQDTIAAGEQQKNNLLQQWQMTLGPTEAKAAGQQVAINMGDQLSKAALSKALLEQPNISVPNLRKVAQGLPMSQEMRAQFTQALAPIQRGRDLVIRPALVDFTKKVLATVQTGQDLPPKQVASLNKIPGLKLDNGAAEHVAEQLQLWHGKIAARQGDVLAQAATLPPGPRRARLESLAQQALVNFPRMQEPNVRNAKMLALLGNKKTWGSRQIPVDEIPDWSLRQQVAQGLKQPTKAASAEQLRAQLNDMRLQSWMAQHKSNAEQSGKLLLSMAQQHGLPLNNAPAFQWAAAMRQSPTSGLSPRPVAALTEAPAPLAETKSEPGTLGGRVETALKTIDHPVNKKDEKEEPVAPPAAAAVVHSPEAQAVQEAVKSKAEPVEEKPAPAEAKTPAPAQTTNALLQAERRRFAKQRDALQKQSGDNTAALADAVQKHQAALKSILAGKAVQPAPVPTPAPADTAAAAIVASVRAMEDRVKLPPEHRQMLGSLLQNSTLPPGTRIKTYQDALEAYEKGGLPAAVEAIKTASQQAQLRSVASGATLGTGMNPVMALQQTSALARAMTEPDFSTAAEQTKQIIRQRTGELARDNERIHTDLSTAIRKWDSASTEDQHAFIHNIETGNFAAMAPEDRDIAYTLRSELDFRRDSIIALGTGKFKNFIENYFPHIWKDPARAQNVIAAALAKRPLEGSKNFLKSRYYDTYEEGLDAGLQPVTSNPIQMALIRMHEMDRYIMAHRVLADLKQQGLVRWYKLGVKPPTDLGQGKYALKTRPADWQQIDDRLFNPQRYNENSGALETYGHYYGHPDAAKILNNYLSPGLRGATVKMAGFNVKPYNLLRAYGNTLNQVQLGLSAFHLFGSSINTVTSDVALGLQKLIRTPSRGGPDFKGAINALGRAASIGGSLVHTYTLGNQGIQEYLSPGRYASLSRDVDALASAGGRVQQDSIYTNHAAQQLRDAIHTWKESGALAKLPRSVQVAFHAALAGIEQTSRPLMDHIIPRMKVGAFLQMAQDIDARADKLGMHPQERQQLYNAAWDSVDNRFGEMVYDNKFIHKTFKDLAFIGVRSQGWNVGTALEHGGGTLDLGKSVAGAVGGRGFELSSRAAWLGAMPLTVGLMGAAYMYLSTGQWPQEMKDYFYPKDATGRRALPSYMRDAFGVANQPLVTVQHKLNPMLEQMADLASNSDYYGVRIRNSDDSTLQQAGEVGKYLAKSFLPIAVQNAENPPPAASSNLLEFLKNELGITQAPRNIDRSPATLKAYEYNRANLPVGPKDALQEAHMQAMSQLREQLQAGQLKGLAAFKPYLQKGLISENDINTLMNERQDSDLVRQFKHLTPEQALNVWRLANPTERQSLRPLLAAKLDSPYLQRLIPEERARITAAIKSAYHQK